MGHQVPVSSELPIMHWVLSEQPNHNTGHLGKPFYREMEVAYTIPAQAGREDTVSHPRNTPEAHPPSHATELPLSAHTCGLLWTSLTT